MRKSSTKVNVTNVVEREENMGETIVIKNRQKRGIYQNLVNELVLADRGDYRRFHENEY